MKNILGPLKSVSLTGFREGDREKKCLQKSGNFLKKIKFLNIFQSVFACTHILCFVVKIIDLRRDYDEKRRFCLVFLISSRLPS